jgi:hypothetical protein
LQIADARAENITIIEAVADRVIGAAAARSEAGSPRPNTNGSGALVPLAVAQLVGEE